MKRFKSFSALMAMVFVLGIYVSSAIGATANLKWDVDNDPSNYETTVTVPVGNTVTVDLYATDIDSNSSGVSSFVVGERFNWYKGMNHDPSWLQCNSITIDPNWPQFTFTDWTSSPGNINAGGAAPLGEGYKGDKKLMTIEFQCLAAGSETFDFTETSPDIEKFRLGKLGGGEYTVDTTAYALTITCGEGGGPTTSLTYANSHSYTQSGQPPRYWKVGKTTKPPPKGVHPEYAQGEPDGMLTGWSPETGQLILGLPSPLKNVDGADLTVWHFGKPDVADVYVSTQSTDPSDWHLLGALSESPFGTVKKDTFDFGSLDNVYFVKIDKRAGGYHTGHYIDAVAGVPGAAPAVPQVDIKINGQDGPLSLHQSDPFTLCIAVNNNGITDDADWWLVANTPAGLYFFTAQGWKTDWMPGYQGPLFYFDPVPLFQDSSISGLGLPAQPGTYTFYFGVDTVKDGQLTFDKLSYDYIEMKVEP